MEGSNSVMLTAIGSSGGNYDELTISGNGISSIENVKFGTDGKTVRIYPNPLRSNKLSIDLVGFENSENVQVKIINLIGQTVFHEKLNNPTHFDINTLNLLSKSVYTVSVQSGSTIILNKLILN
ncbi:MAG: T9SS type A sorting domain-containing protein [Paludibacter sp.]|nr:T9SS type A sorting domain-containing protein [Paludibacter sp.]